MSFCSWFKDLFSSKKLQSIPAIPKPIEVPYFGAPWIGSNIDLLGRNESDKTLNARLVPEWKLEGLDYKTLMGNDHAWCSLLVNADFRKVNINGTDSAAASSWTAWGVPCPYWFGCVLPIRHPKGGRHVARFLYWIDESKKIAATIDGNRGDLFCIAKTNLGPGGDMLIPGPRWPKGQNVQPGQFVSKETVLKKYPFLKVGGTVGESTT